MMSERIRRLRQRDIFLFWAPLAATWLMMAVEGPVLTAVIARLPVPKENLAAFGVAYAFALFVEAPVIMLMSAATALARDRAAFIKLRRFTLALNIFVTLVLGIIILPPVFAWIARDGIGLPARVADLTHRALVIMLPWPGAIGYRRLYQGVLIRAHLTRRVAYGTLIRLATIFASTAFLTFETPASGVIVGAAALSIAVCTEAVAGRLMAWRCTRDLLQQDSAAGPSEQRITYPFIARFYYPLALTSMLGLGVHPIVTFFLGQSRNALESLAVLPVVNALVFLFRSLGLSFQETGIALMGDHFEALLRIRRFALLLGIMVTAGLSLIAFSPLSRFWFESVSGLSGALAAFAIPPARILVAIPGLSVLLSFQRAVMVIARRTRPVTLATLIEVLMIVVVLKITIACFAAVGVIGAACAYVLGRFAANLYLGKQNAAAIAARRVPYELHVLQTDTTTPV